MKCLPGSKQEVGNCGIDERGDEEDHPTLNNKAQYHK